MMDPCKQLQEIPAISSEALEAFRRELPQLLIFVNDKFNNEDKFFTDSACPAGKTALIKQFNRNMGSLMLGVYEFSLYEDIIEELLWHVAAAESRGLKLDFFSTAVKSWIMAIHYTIKRPQSDQLVQPLVWLQLNAARLYEKLAVHEADLDGDAKNFLDLLLQKNRKFAAEYVLTLIRSGKTIENVYSSVLLPAYIKIRLMWRRSIITIADEHAAIDTLRYIIFRVMDNIFGERSYPFKALVACMPGEESVLSGEIFANFLEIKGWSVSFIGHTAAAEDIIHSAAAIKPQVVALSIFSIASLPGASNLIRQIHTLLPEAKTAVEGRAALIAQKRFEPMVDAVIAGFDAGHNKMLTMVMPHA